MKHIAQTQAVHAIITTRVRRVPSEDEDTAAYTRVVRAIELIDADSNHISCATGSQWHHEALYHTASGKWILHTYPNYQGILPTYTEVNQKRAAAWLVTNNYDAHPACEQEYAELEIK